MTFVFTLRMCVCVCVFVCVFVCVCMDTMLVQTYNMANVCVQNQAGTLLPTNVCMDTMFVQTLCVAL